MPREVLIAIGGGLMSAVSAVAFFGGSAFGLFFVYFASVPLLMVGLGLGSRAATIAAGSGIIATSIFGGLLPAGFFALAQAMPAWVACQLLIMQTSRPAAEASASETPGNDETRSIQWCSPGLALAALAVIGAVMIAIAALFAEAGGLKEMVETYLGTAFEFMAPGVADEHKEQMVASLASIFPGAIGASWVTMVALNAIVAQGILVRADRNLRPTPPYAGLDLPLWLSWPLVAAAAAALAGNVIGADGLGYAGYNIAMVLAAPYFFLGLAVVHTLARRVAATGMVLVGVYGVILISLWAALVVAGVGVAEQWVGLRDRFVGDKNEDEGPRPFT